MKTLLSIGHGYTAQALARRLTGWRIIGTTRTPEGVAELAAQGIEARLWPGEDLPLGEATHLLTSVPPGAADPVLAAHGAQIAAAGLEWVGYLSTTAVYGHHDGAWVDETTPPAPSTPRGAARLKAEQAWTALGVPLHIFRLAGIYGPGRGPFEKVRDGSARRIIKPGQVFSRIHVDDIAQAIEAALALETGTVLNIADDEPAPPQDVITEAARLLGIAPPPEEDFETAKSRLTPMALEFYSANRRITNALMKEELSLTLLHPTYREGLRAILKAEQGNG